MTVAPTHWLLLSAGLLCMLVLSEAGTEGLQAKLQSSIAAKMLERSARRQDGLARRRKVDANKEREEAQHFHARIHELTGRVNGAVAAHEAKAVEVHQRVKGTTTRTNETRTVVLERHEGLSGRGQPQQQPTRRTRQERLLERLAERPGRVTTTNRSAAFGHGELR